MKIAGYETHPAADLFPMLPDAELAELSEDIRSAGLLAPVVVLDDAGERKILDGRNRLRACELAGVEPRFELWSGNGSPIAWVVSQNLRRRHLNESQRAMVAAGLVPMFEAEAREHSLSNLKKGAAAPDGANLPARESGRAREKAATAVNVSPRSVASAVKVLREAPAEVVEAVKRGEVAVSRAAAEVSRREPKPKAAREEDWTCTLTLSLPHSVLPSVVRALTSMGFAGGGGSSRKMKLTRKAAKSAA